MVVYGSSREMVKLFCKRYSENMSVGIVLFEYRYDPYPPLHTNIFSHLSDIIRYVEESFQIFRKIRLLLYIPNWTKPDRIPNTFRQHLKYSIYFRIALKVLEIKIETIIKKIVIPLSKRSATVGSLLKPQTCYTFVKVYEFTTLEPHVS